jgi:HAD superfamily hydrolase (TIGR01662 family)
MRKADKRAVFFDRDGTIIYDLGYPRELEKIQLLPGVGEALFELKQRGFCLVLVSNQSGVGRGGCYHRKMGMTLFQPNHQPVHIPAVARHVYDVTGAGDTVVAILALLWNRLPGWPTLLRAM